METGCSTKRKVLFVIESLGCGGAEKSLVSLLSLLDKSRYDLYIWMIHPEGAFLSFLPAGVEIVEQPRYNLFQSFLLKISLCLYSVRWRMNSLFKRMEYWGETYYKSIGWATKVPKGKWDVVFAYHQGLVTYIVADNFTNSKKVGCVNADIFKTGYNIKYNSGFYRRYDCICPVSDALHDLMDKKMPEFSNKYYTIWDIINPSVTRELAKHPIEKLRKENDEYVIVTTGRLHVLKGYDMAVGAAMFLKQKGLKFKWYFIGDGPQRCEIEQQINMLGLQNNVRLLGMKVNPYPYMAQCDVYVQTSRHEGFGMTIAEAKILGVPIVSTNFDVVYDQITHEENGLIAEMSAESISEQIHRLLVDERLREHITDTLLKEENCTSRTEVKKVEQLIDMLTA